MRRSFLCVSALLLCQGILAQQVTPDSIAKLRKPVGDGKYIFSINSPDNNVSPLTGMTRRHWQEAGLYLLSGAFNYIHTINDPMLFPKQPGKSYPKDGKHTRTEMLEGLCRTLFIAAPLLKENPKLVLNNIPVAEYYKHQFAKLVDKASDTYIAPRSKNGGPSQILVEFGALSMSLTVAPEILFDPLPESTKAALASTMLSYADGPTVGSNWRFFNIFILSFYKTRGHQVNDKLLDEYLAKSLAQYSGDGWYNDSPQYDYYSMWAFQMYGTLWSEYYGKQINPAYAEKFISNFRDLKNNYPYLFSRDGEMVMWGRSITYRIGSVIPFPLMGLLKDQDVNYGWMRRISSGVLQQFLEHPDFMKDDVPVLGFYGPFEHAVQAYSCRGSVYWMGKAFYALLLPADNPFWTAKENNGAWEKELSNGKVLNKLQAGSNILLTDYPGIGASEIRARSNTKFIGNWEPFRGDENYNRLAYNSAFPWQTDGPNGEVAMNYLFRNKQQQWEPARLYTFKRYNDGVYYRDIVLETDSNVTMNLADITLDNGILRVDRNTSAGAVEMRLGHYALPAINGPVNRSTRKVRGYEVQIIDNGKYQLAMVPLLGWDKMETLDTKGLNPVAENSAVINTATKRDKVILATLMLWKKAGEAWKDEELVPVKKLKYSIKNGIVEITFVNSDKKTVRFE